MFNAFKELVRAWSKWSKWIPIDNCGLHEKFKMKTRGIESVKANPEKLRKSKARIDEKTKYGTMADLLDHGMSFLPFSISLKCVSLLRHVFLLKMLDTSAPNQHKDRMKRLLMF